MELKAILDRLDRRRAELGINSDAELSRRAGMSVDGIRNWRRRARTDPHFAGVNATSLTQVARALGVSSEWLMYGAGTGSGLAEDAATFTGPTAEPARDIDPGLIAPLFRSVGHPGLYRLKGDMPAFALRDGDIVVIDHGRAAQAGELVVATIANEQTGEAATTLRLYMPPYLAAGTPDMAETLIRTDAMSVAILAPVAGMIRNRPQRSVQAE